MRLELQMVSSAGGRAAGCYPTGFQVGLPYDPLFAAVAPAAPVNTVAPEVIYVDNDQLAVPRTAKISWSYRHNPFPIERRYFLPCAGRGTGRCRRPVLTSARKNFQATETFVAQRAVQSTVLRGLCTARSKAPRASRPAPGGKDLRFQGGRLHS